MVIYAEHLFRNPQINMRNLVEEICYKDIKAAQSLALPHLMVLNPYNIDEPEHNWYKNYSAMLGVECI